jgi:hypothetical protein
MEVNRARLAFFIFSVLNNARLLITRHPLVNVHLKSFFQASVFILIISLFQLTGTNGQTSTVVLSQNGSSSNASAPQGALKYQRGFYLIRRDELAQSGLKSGDTINCVGFTISAAQSDTTIGKFKVYLQNTSDTVSRSDTNWTTRSGILTNSFFQNNLFPANYEWQVRSNCSSFSSIYKYSNKSLPPCQPPSHLVTDSITDETAKLSWVAPVSIVSNYRLEYSRSDTIQWTGVNTTNSVFYLSGLLPGKGYQWRIKAICPSDSSDFVYESFNTEQSNNCNPPSGLMVNSITMSSALLDWAAAPGAAYYTVRYRRYGSPFWNETFAFTDSLTISVGLDPGTLFQWAVRSNCGIDSSGLFIPGPNFVTSGATVCYPPQGLLVDSISDTGVKFYWDTVPGTTSYELRYRAKDVISWQTAIAPMKLVHRDSIIIPDTYGPYYVPFKGPNIDTFVYSGSAIYVAWEYKDSIGPLSSKNISLTNDANSIIKGVNGQDSVRYNLSFISRSDTSLTMLDSILGDNDQRPETRLCSNSLRDSVAVVSVYALGKYAPRYTASPISALIRNYSSAPQTYVVTLTVKEQISNVTRYTIAQNITIGPDTVGLIEFTGWMPAALEIDSLIVSVPGRQAENVLNNNRNFYIQMVNGSLVSFDDGSKSVSQAGTDTLAGYTLSRHLMTGCGKVNAAQVYLSRDAIGQGVYAILLDTALNILAQSAPFTPDSSQVDQYHSFYFTDSVRVLQNEEYYIGLGQPHAVLPYFPVGVQWEGVDIRDSAYFRFDIAKDSLWHQPGPGRLMIRAEVIPRVPAATIEGDQFLCNGTMDTLIASTILPRYADSVIAFSSQNQFKQYGIKEVLGTPNVFPQSGTLPGAWVSERDTGREFIVLRFARPDSINFIDIFETLHPGTVDSVFVRDEGTGMFNLVWSGVPSPALVTHRKNRIDFPMTPYKVSQVKLSFNMTAVPGYSAIDAVCIGRLTKPGLFTSISWTGGSTNDTLIINAPGGFKLTATDSYGCSSTDSIHVITPIPVTPTIMADDTTICPGDSIKLKSNIAGGNVWNTGANSDSIYVKTPGYYWVTYNDGTGCGMTIDSIYVTLDTLPVVHITGDTVICPQSITTLHGGSHLQYKWSNGAISESIDVSYGGLLILKVTDGNGCNGYDTVITTEGNNPVLNISGNLIFCPGDSTLLRASSGLAGYLWSTSSTADSIYAKSAGNYSVLVTDAHGCQSKDSVTISIAVPLIPTITALDTTICPGDSVMIQSDQSSNNLWNTGETSQVIYAKTGGAYYVTYNDGSGCVTNVSNTIHVTVDTIPIVQVLGDTIICSGSIHNFDAGIHDNYLWSTGENAQQIDISTQGTFSVIVTDGNGCKGSDTITTRLSVTPQPVISGNLMVCSADSTILHSSAGASYLWSTGATADSIIVKNTGTFSVTVTNSDGCIGESSQVQTILSDPLNLMIGGGDGFCPLDSVELTADAGYSSYLWSNGVTTPNIRVKSAGTYSVSVVDVHGCKGSATKEIAAFVNPTAFISGTLSFCDGGNTTALEAGLGYKNYIWSTGETTHSISVSSIGTYSVTVTDLNGCTDSTSATVTVEGSLPAVPGVIFGDTTGMCNVNTASTYSVLPVPNSTCYIWHVPSGVTIVDGFMMDSSVFANSIKVIFDNTFTGGFIEVSAHNDCGASQTWQGSSLHISAAPGSLPGNISGHTSGVCKSLKETYSIPPVSTAISYLWTVPLGAMILSGQGTPSIDVSFASSYRKGDICVQYSTDCGTSPFSCITVSPEPLIDSLISGPSLICPNASNVMYSVPAVFGATSYEWNVPTGAAIISGQGTNQIKVNFGTHAGIVTVTASNVCGISPNQFIKVNIGSCFQTPSDRFQSDQSNSQNDFVRIFPNPSEGIVHVLVHPELISPDSRIQITDELGRVVYTYPLPVKHKDSYQLDLTSLNKGIYFLNLKNETRNIVSKIVLR